MVEGAVAPGFEGVRAAFERCFEELGETGAGFCAFAGGRVVADLRGGLAADALVHLYSVAKPSAAFCVLVLADRGRIGAVLVRRIPRRRSFANGGLEEEPGRDSLARRTTSYRYARKSRPAPCRGGQSLLLNAAVGRRDDHVRRRWRRCPRQPVPHARAVSPSCGRRLGAFWREEVAAPWRLDVHIGLGESELARAADLTGDLPEGGGGLYEQALGNPPGARDLAVVNGEAWRRAEVPAINGHGTAAGSARFFEGLRAGGELDGVRLVAPGIVDAMRAGELRARDELLEDEVCWGLGVWVEPERSGGERAPRDRGFGMGGIGGSLALAGPELGIAEAYVTTRMGTHDRADAMDAALRAAVAATA